MTNNTEGKNTVTGASSGIGLAIARELEEKFQVKAAVFCVDLAQEDSAQKLFDYCAEKKFIIEILVNNAGLFFF